MWQHFSRMVMWCNFKQESLPIILGLTGPHSIQTHGNSAVREWQNAPLSWILSPELASNMSMQHKIPRQHYSKRAIWHTFKLDSLSVSKGQTVLPIVQSLHALCPGRVKVTIQDQPAQQNRGEVSGLLLVTPLGAVQVVHVGLVGQPHEEGVMCNLPQQSPTPDAVLELTQQLGNTRGKSQQSALHFPHPSSFVPGYHKACSTISCPSLTPGDHEACSTISCLSLTPGDQYSTMIQPVFNCGNVSSSRQEKWQILSGQPCNFSSL